MQGVGPDGTLYVSDNYTFHTAPATTGVMPPTKPPGQNVALISAGAHVTAVSSNYGGGALDSPFGANNAIDGDLVTEWSSDGDGDKAWIEIDLGKAYEIGAVGFRTRTMGTSAQIERFQVSPIGARRSGRSICRTRDPSTISGVSAKARRLRFEVLKSSGGNTGASAIEVYAQ